MGAIEEAGGPAVGDVDDGSGQSDASGHDLADVAFFAGFDDSTRIEIARAARAVHLPAGQWLFHKGDEGDSMYVVRSGRLELVREDGGEAVGVGLLGPGSAVGELSLLTGTQRSVSVRARRDSDVIAIDRDRVAELLQTSRPFALALLRAVGEHLRSSGVLARARPRAAATVVWVVAARAGVPLVDLVQAMTAELGRWSRTEVVDRERADRALGDRTDAMYWGRYVSELEREADHVLLVSQQGQDALWESFCRRQADRTVALVDPLGEPTELEALVGCDLVFCRAVDARRRQPWLDALRPRSQQHASHPQRLGPVAARVARRLCGRSIGVVLSGGGARGFAHIGALGVLAEAGVEIDRIGGCSMGAFLGALHANGLSAAEMQRVCDTELVRHHPFNDYTIPRRSLIKGEKAEGMLRRVFSTVSIEELDTDYFCVSADLLTAELVVHRRGLVWEAVGSSMSLPGLVRPAHLDGHLLVDGGVLNNLPVDVMVATDDGPVLAIDVMGRRPKSNTVVNPSIVDTLAWATVLGSWRRAEENRARAQLVVTPDVGDTPLLAFERLDTVVEAGRRAMRSVLRDGPAWLVAGSA